MGICLGGYVPGVAILPDAFSIYLTPWALSNKVAWKGMYALVPAQCDGLPPSEGAIQQVTLLEIPLYTFAIDVGYQDLRSPWPRAGALSGHLGFLAPLPGRMGISPSAPVSHIVYVTVRPLLTQVRAYVLVWSLAQ